LGFTWSQIGIEVDLVPDIRVVRLAKLLGNGQQIVGGFRIGQANQQRLNFSKLLPPKSPTFVASNMWFQCQIALAYVKKEVNITNTRLGLQS
jgi:hypothetical protein